MNWLKKKLLKWLVPEYECLVEFKDEVDSAKRELQAVDKEITFNEPVIFIGSLSNCHVNVKPTIKPEIILAKLDMAAALQLLGDHTLITNNMFHQEPTAIKLDTDHDKD